MAEEEFQAVILAGGNGFKLAPFTETTPKSLLPITNSPLLVYQLALLEDAGFDSETSNKILCFVFVFRTSNICLF